MPLSSLVNCPNVQCSDEESCALPSLQRLPSSVFIITQSSFVTFIAWSIRVSEQLKPCRSLRSNLG